MVPAFLRVLLVEDNPGDADLVRDAFEASGPESTELVHVVRLADGLAAVRNQDFDVVLLDLSLPDASGLESVRRLHSAVPEMPLVVLTGQNSEELGARAVGEGAQDYLVKGEMPAPLLLRAVRYAAARHRYARALAEERVARAAAEAMQIALRQADQRKDEFLALLAHELRNPLAPILNSVELIRHGGDHVDRRTRAVKVIEKQVLHMVRLIDDLLDVSRISRGKIMLKREPLDLCSLIASSVELAQPLIDRGGHELFVMLPPEPVFVEGDKTRLTQIFANLLNNAAKFTLQRGIIRISLEVTDAQAIVSVKDNGIGIDADLLPRVFDFFVQGDTSLERSRGGLGLGLALARSLVELHGGSLEGFSPGPGEGSEFVVRLPLSKHAGAQSGLLQGASMKSAPPNRLRVLVVDDNVDATETMTAVLEVMGHQVKAALDGKAALRLAEEYQPHAVLLDISMPEMNGYEVARRLRELPTTSSALLIAVTGLGHEEDRRRALEAGFDHHLTKPVDSRAVQELLMRSTLREPS